MKSLKSFVTTVLLALTGTGAAEFSLAPVSLSIDARQVLTTQTILTNRERTPVGFTAELLRWTQVNGENVLAPTQDGLVNPARFTVAPGRTQVIRVGLRSRPVSPAESYRLIIRQVLDTASPGAGDAGQGGSRPEGVQLVPRYIFSLPLFVTQGAGGPQVSARLERSAGRLALSFQNSGGGHEVYRTLKVSGAGLSADLGTIYILPGSTMRVTLPPEAGQAQQLEVTMTDRALQPRREVLSVPAP